MGEADTFIVGGREGGRCAEGEGERGRSQPAEVPHCIQRREGAAAAGASKERPREMAKTPPNKLTDIPRQPFIRHLDFIVIHSTLRRDGTVGTNGCGITVAVFRGTCVREWNE